MLIRRKPMKNIILSILIACASLASIPLNASTEGIAVIDYRTVFLGTDLARERFEELRDSSENKSISDESQKKQQELNSVSE